MEKRQGPFVIVTSSSDAKLTRAREIGADVTLNHAAVDVPKEVRRVTDRPGVEVIVENVGQATWEQSLRMLARRGRLVTCGATTGPTVAVDVRRMFWYQWSLLGSTMGNAAEYREIVTLLGRGALRPIVDAVFPLADWTRAFERLAGGDQMGKIVLDIAS